jgi:hypothetical protein
MTARTAKPACEVRWCLGGLHNRNRAEIRVTECIGDGAFATFICRPCADAIGVKGGDDLPEPEEVRKRLRAAKRNGTK